MSTIKINDKLQFNKYNDYYYVYYYNIIITIIVIAIIYQTVRNAMTVCENFTHVLHLLPSILHCLYGTLLEHRNLLTRDNISQKYIEKKIINNLARYERYDLGFLIEFFYEYIKYVISH